MGRYNTGAYTNKECKRINISYLKKHGYLVKGSVMVGTLSWTSGSTIGIKCVWTDRIYIELDYVVTRNYDGSKHKVSYKIPIVEVPSNLGKGYLLYFLCPFSNRKCRILYQAYGGLHYKSKYAYKYPIYYSSQICSKKFRSMERSFEIREEINKLRGQMKKKYYKGRMTKIYKRILRLEERENYFEALNSIEIAKMFNRYSYLG